MSLLESSFSVIGLTPGLGFTGLWLLGEITGVVERYDNVHSTHHGKRTVFSVLYYFILMCLLLELILILLLIQI